MTGLFAFDRHGADGAFMGGGGAIAAIGGQLRKVQTGYVRSYALSVLVGVLIVAVAMLAVNF